MKQQWCVAKGQHEPLTQRLQKLLDQYPMESTIKEMLQNAVDSGASEFGVVADWRAHPTKSVFTPDMAGWQGPAIYFYNDGLFREKDWGAIVLLGQGGKRDEVGKIGRHGIGFNSIFNLTDLPSIWSGSTQLFLDPHVHHLADVGATLSNPGIQIDINPEVEHPMHEFHDQYAPYSKLSMYESQFAGPEFTGTLIRAPLRRTDALRPSQISNCAMGEEMWTEVGEKISAEMHQYLIFPENVTDIRFSDISKNGSTIEKGVWKRVSKESETLLNDKGVAMARKDVAVQALHTETVWKYRIIRITHGDSYAEVATLVTPARGVGREEYKFFCGLPLSFYTGCSMHVSALFWPTQVRRSTTHIPVLSNTLPQPFPFPYALPWV